MIYKARYQFDMEWDNSDVQPVSDKDVIAIFVDKFLKVSEVFYFTEKVVSYAVSFNYINGVSS
jgi:hypothetical protein